MFDINRVKQPVYNIEYGREKTSEPRSTHQPGHRKQGTNEQTMQGEYCVDVEKHRLHPGLKNSNTRYTEIFRYLISTEGVQAKPLNKNPS